MGYSEMEKKLIRGDRLKFLREKLDLSQGELGELAGIAQNHISSIETGKRGASDKTKKRLAEALKTNVSYLIGETDDPAPQDSPPGDTFPFKKLFEREEWRQFPVLEPTVVACAGYGNGGMTTIYADAEEFIPLPASMVGTISVDPGKYPFALRIEGDSMEDAGIVDGSYVLVNPAEEVYDGDPALVIFGRNSNCAVKWVYFHNDGGVELRSASLKYPPRAFSVEDIEEGLFHIVGKVVWTGGKPRSGA
ncbi:XRE family transcriptional regulator [Dethiosulfovibrio sp. F2B]|uniref:LexA family protein n=1 Tax=Dethiosulfovibrio faecalis TaxID=2720018 RepID=UPI001F18D97C|nr:LexA family transcriptional regulator [Dethiosulfovibrio faecalis]MCF4151789.1 XRE family transcriptional regulator [Dethiosulfovibrio faecalis]